MGGGSARAEFTATDQVCNPRGAVIGGIVATMLDMVMSAAYLSSLEGEEMPRGTVEMKANFVGPGRAGRLVGESHVVHKGGSLVFLEASLRDEDESLVATCAGTFVVGREG